MTKRIWELHSHQLGGAIRTTVMGDADVAGLVLSERAYLLAVRDFRPRQLVDLVREAGPVAAAMQLVAHYGTEEALNASGGRSLVVCRGSDYTPVVRRSDEAPALAAAPPRT